VAAAEVRHRWLASSLFPRRSAPREAAAFLAAQLLAMPDPLHSGLAAARHKPLFTTLTGRTAPEWEQECGTAAAGRLTIAMLAPIVTAYEHAMTDGDKRAELRLMQHSVGRDTGVPAGREGAGGGGRIVIDGSACTACAWWLPAQQCCI
jgi:hypothetical protein